MNSLLAMARARAELGIDKPACDLGYCDCGTVWNMPEMKDCGYDPNLCPDCGLPPLFIERGFASGARQ